MRDFTAASAWPGAKADYVSEALLQRGKAAPSNLHGAIADYSAAIEVPDTPLEDAAHAAHVSRGEVRQQLGDLEGAGWCPPRSRPPGRS
jgi:hypothetical protein